MRGLRRFPGVVLAVSLTISIAACTQRYVADYDPQVDQGLTALYTDVGAFVDRMVEAAGTTDGEYASNRAFYAEERAVIASLQVRIEAHKALSNCPSTDLLRGAIQRVVPATPSSGLLPTQSSADILAQFPKDDCGVVLFTLMQGALGDLERFHRAQGPRGIPASARDPILVGGLGALIRAAMQVEIAKKLNNPAGSN